MIESYNQLDKPIENLSTKKELKKLKQEIKEGKKEIKLEMKNISNSLKKGKYEIELDGKIKVFSDSNSTIAILYPEKKFDFINFKDGDTKEMSWSDIEKLYPEEIKLAMEISSNNIRETINKGREEIKSEMKKISDSLKVGHYDIELDGRIRVFKLNHAGISPIATLYPGKKIDFINFKDGDTKEMSWSDVEKLYPEEIKLAMEISSNNTRETINKYAALLESFLSKPDIAPKGSWNEIYINGFIKEVKERNDFEAETLIKYIFNRFGQFVWRNACVIRFRSAQDQGGYISPYEASKGLWFTKFHDSPANYYIDNTEKYNPDIAKIRTW